MSMDMIKNRLGAVTTGKILDFGTGAGEFLQLLTECFKDYESIIGIDTNDKALDRARENFKDPRISFQNGNAEKTEFEDQCFDVVCISNSLHHLPDPTPVLKEMDRVLKPGGMFIINEMYSDNQSIKQMSHVRLHHFFAEIDRIMGDSHKETYKRNEIIRLFEGTEMQNREVFDFNTDEEQRLEADEIQEKELIGNVVPAMEARLERIKDYHRYEELKDLMVEHREYFEKNGFFGATQLLLIGTK